MKTLSVRQPWASLIVQGRRTLELRSWTVRYRGPLAIHASRTVAREACLAHGLDPDQVTVGAVIGIVDLEEIVALDAAAFAARRDEHLAGEPWPGAPLFGWRLAHPRVLAAPMPLHGRMGLFEAMVAEDAVPQEEPLPPAAPPTTTRRGTASQTAVRLPRLGVSGAASAARPFELRVLAAAGEPPYRLALWQRAVEPPGGAETGRASGAAARRVAELGGWSLRAAADQVMAALRSQGYKPTDLAASRREPFHLDEESGVRLGLIFLAVRTLSRAERVEAIVQGIRAMTSEEAYYWYSKCTGGPQAERAQRALRVLLAEE